MKAVILASHGQMASGALESAQMILGDQENCDSFCVTVDMDLDKAKRVFKEKTEKLDLSEGLVILVDIFGGTPCNVASAYLLEHPDTLLISGMNLPMILTLFTKRDASFDEIDEALSNAYAMGFTNINKKFGEDKDDGSEDL